MPSFRALVMIVAVVATFIINTRVVLADNEIVTVTNSSSFVAHVGIEHGGYPYGRRIKLKAGQSGSLDRGGALYNDIGIYVFLTTPDEKTVCKGSKYFFQLKPATHGARGLSAVVVHDKCVMNAS